jgi:hypothetical protein
MLPCSQRYYSSFRKSLRVVAGVSFSLTNVLTRLSTRGKTEADVLRSKPLVKPNNFRSVLGLGSAINEQTRGREIQVSETKGSSTTHLCNISLPLAGNLTFLTSLIHPSH